MKRLCAAAMLLPLASVYPASDAQRLSYTQPVAELQDAELQKFFKGRSLVHQIWVVPPSENREIAGLGPLYNRLSCIACHAGNGRGFAPDSPDDPMRSMMVRLSVPGTDRHNGPRPHPTYGGQLNENGVPGVPGEGRAVVRYTERSVKLSGGEVVSLRKPSLSFTSLAYGKFPEDMMTSPRIAPPIFGLGLLEAVPESTIVAMADAKKPDGIKGKVNRVWDEAQQKTALGRFGWKANMPSLRQQIAGAFVGDMGITSALFAQENCTASQTECLSSPSAGNPELTSEELDAVEFYHLALAPPPQRDSENPAVKRGFELFRQAQCSACHQPQLQTGEFAAYPALSYRMISPYTDLLLHDMGNGLADNRPDYLANGREWRTPALWGIGLAKRVEPRAGYLHDGRARTLMEAILWHKGEAAHSALAVAKMKPADRAALLSFLESL